MGKKKISQSLVKALFEYKQDNECGLVIKARYIDGMEFPSTDAMELGNYFEYICTGSKARDGHTPKEKILKNGKVATDYMRMNQQKENYNRILKTYNFKITDIDYHFETDKFTGIADVIAEKDGEKCIIDIKTSGQIDNKWSDYGWDEAGIETKDKLLIQAVHYKMLAKEEWGIDNIPFYFFVFSTKNETDCKLYKIDCDESTLLIHENNFNDAIKFFDNENEKGWVAKPEMKRCSNCPLKENCKFSIDVPDIKTIYY